MRDLLVAAIVFGSLPFILKRPFWGIVMLAGLGYLNPHRLCYGFMLTMPVVQIVALATLIGMLLSRETKRMVWSREVWVLLIFVFWMGLTTTQAFYFEAAVTQYEKVVKIQILTFMTLIMLTSRERVHLLVWTIVISLGFYGVKGGIFTIATGGAHRVQGPWGTFIGGNNEMALALVMTIPLMRYLQLHETSKILRHGLTAAMVLTVIAAAGTQSRGALVALAITGTFFWWKSRHKFATAALVLVAGAAALSLMPPEWFERMATIKAYQEDGSAMGRIYAWQTALGIANNRVFGGGFETWGPRVFYLYGPGGAYARDVHSIYFEVMGEHGWVGFGLFMSLLALTWLKCGRIVRVARTQPGMLWARDLALMIQVSLVAYMSAGAFLGLAYFDYLYHLVAIVVCLYQLEVSAKTSRPTASVPVAQMSLAGALRHARQP